MNDLVGFIVALTALIVSLLPVHLFSALSPKHWLDLRASRIAPGVVIRLATSSTTRGLLQRRVPPRARYQHLPAVN